MATPASWSFSTMNRKTHFSTNSASVVSLLTLPIELRELIWRVIFDDILIDPEMSRFSRPKTKFNGLLLTCVQIRHEIITWFPRTILPHRRIDILILHQPQAYVFHNFRLLALEIPFQRPAKFFQEAALAVKNLSGSLQDLRLFFVGKDAFNVSTWLHGCGLREPAVGSISSKLTIDGQRHEERQPLFEALYYLQNLHSISIENANYPILQAMVIKNKWRLRNLRLIQDPRSTLHCSHTLRGGNMRRMIFPPVSDLASVETLHVSANSCLTALQVASKMARTLKHLTWVVPDLARQSGPALSDWLSDTSLLLRNLGGAKGNPLETLRVCIEGATYESNHSFGQLIGGFSMYLPGLRNLRCLELHLHSRSNWFGGEVIDALPSSVTRLYLSDRFIPHKVLTSRILQQYGGSSPSQSYHHSRTSPSQPHNHHRRSISPSPLDSHYHSPDSNHYVSSSPSEFHYQSSHYKNITIECEQIGITGEDTTREDFIFLHDGRLGFVGYEFEQSRAITISMLTLNGRLLDRERNLHLCLYNGGFFIPPRQSKSIVDDMLAKEMEMNEIGEGWTEREEDDWVFSQDSPHAWYFGMENKAQEVFDGEAVARAEKLDPSKWVEEVAYEEYEHWMTDE